MTLHAAITAPALNSPAFHANPYPFYAELRAKAPVYPVEGVMRGQRAWLITRYDDVSAMLRSDDFAKNMAAAKTPDQMKRAPKIPGVFAPLTRNLLFLDPPDHTRLRALVHKAFSPRLVEAMRAQTEELTAALLDRMAAQRGTIDLISAFALPLPITLIGRILGVPEKDNGRFHRWTQAFTSVGAGGPAVVLAMPSIFQFVTYLRTLIRQKASAPADDLISALIAAQEQDDHLTEDEVLAMVFLLLSAGHETTVNLLASGTLALLEQRDQWQRLHDEPAVIKTGVEELLRYVTPAETSTERYARHEVTVAGTTIPRGDLVLGVIASANRDETRFTQPDVLDLERADNKHLSFGQGLHYCVGAPLSRLEAQIALPALAARFPNLRLAVPSSQLQWRSTMVLRGLKALPVDLGV